VALVATWGVSDIELASPETVIRLWDTLQRRQEEKEHWKAACAPVV